MAYEQREGQGSLFKNDKRTKDSQPNATGRCMVGGVEYYMDAWTKDGAKGKWQSIAFKPVQAAPAPTRPPAPATQSFDDYRDDDIPF